MQDTDNGADTIVVIHGLRPTARSWELSEKRYTDRAYKLINRCWPGLEGEVEALNADPSPIARVTIEVTIDDYEKNHPQPPINGPAIRREDRPIAKQAHPSSSRRGPWWLARVVMTITAWPFAFLAVLALFTLFGDELGSLSPATRALVVSGILVTLMANVVIPVLNSVVNRFLTRIASHQ